MADDLKQTGKPDDSRINVDQQHELSYWSEKFGVSRDELRKAVQAAGPMVKDVQRQRLTNLWRRSDGLRVAVVHHNINGAKQDYVGTGYCPLRYARSIECEICSRTTS